MSSPEENITMILADWLGALRRCDFEVVERSMDPDIVWQGVREDFVCPDRAAVLEMLREWQREDHGVEALELVATEDRVVLGVRSTQLQEIGGVPLGGQIFNVFTLSDGRIVRIDDYPRRSEALGVTGPGGTPRPSALLLTPLQGISWKLLSRKLTPACVAKSSYAPTPYEPTTLRRSASPPRWEGSRR